MKSFGNPIAQLLVLTAAPTVLGGCAHYPENQPLRDFAATTGYRFKVAVPQAADTLATIPAVSSTTRPSSDPDDVFIVLCFSGGGTRAAAFSYGVLEELRDPRNPDRTLLDEVDVISSVPGGSFTAAYYGLFGDRIFCDFPRRFLYRDVELDLLLSAINPINLWRIASPWFSRIDLAAEYYGREIFDRKTFADLTALHRRPFLLINATDMSLGCRFEFTQSQFDLIGSDLSTVPIGRAVAASSAFPVLLAPLTLNNYPKPADFKPKWIKTAEQDTNRGLSPTSYEHAKQAKAWLNDKDKPYVHLIDGGISDNIGFRGIWQRAQLEDNTPDDLNIRSRVNSDKIHKLVVILVDAKPAESDKRDSSPTTPWVGDVIENISTAPMENYSFDTLQLWPQTMEIQRRMGEADPTTAWAQLQTYFVLINFDGVREASEREYLQNLGTSYHLSKPAVGRLCGAAREQLRGAHCVQYLLKVLAGARYDPRECLTPTNSTTTPTTGTTQGTP